MKKILVTAVVAGLIGFAAGNAFFYLASPLWIDREVNETLPAELMVSTLATGQFTDADSFHQGSGTATVVETAGGAGIVRLTDFEVTNGPDLEVWLVKNGDITSSSDVTDSEWVSLGQLKGNIGDQNYIVPEGTDLSEFGSVVIWCEQFSVLFSAATLVTES
ncbi:DM13 domain-containing protein [Bauldia sp.]|uniref:DM13 domain-containing protein n=1 Tax=Bauldia sp. TaxID=2575872 RepID=UPI003BAB15E9